MNISRSKTASTTAPRGVLPQRLLVTALAFAIGACASTSHYRLPDVAAPDGYPSDTRSGDAGNAHFVAGAQFPASDIAADPWWKGFGDARLEAFIDDVLAHNNDLASAALRVRRAQLDAGLSGDALLPQLGGSASGGYSRQLDGDGEGQHTHGANFSVRYEVDLWGRLRTARDAARLEAEASAEDREATALALVGTASRLYTTLGFLNQRIAAADASLERVEKTRALVDVQYRAGAVSGVELRESEQSLHSQQAARSALVQQRVETRNAIAVLRDGQRWPESDEPQNLSAIAHPPLPPAVPAELLGRRPDLRAAELRLRRAFANVDVVRTSYYPAFSLSAGAAGSSSHLVEVLRDPVASLGAALSLPFLGWNEMRLNVRASKVDLEIAISGFRQSLHQALSEVDNTLSARTQLALQEAALAAALTEAIAIERLYEVRYRAGATPLRTWLEAQESQRSAEIALAQARLAQFQNDVLMFQSLGGGAGA
jgi:NodT family efflux transporter outer membrane factor (OMF) lipoprotein